MTRTTSAAAVNEEGACECGLMAEEEAEGHCSRGAGKGGGGMDRGGWIGERGARESTDLLHCPSAEFKGPPYK